MREIDPFQISRMASQDTFHVQTLCESHHIKITSKWKYYLDTSFTCEFTKINDTKTYIFRAILKGEKQFSNLKKLYTGSKKSVITSRLNSLPQITEPTSLPRSPSFSFQSPCCICVRVKIMSLVRHLCAGTTFCCRGQNLQWKNPEIDQTVGIQGICYAIVCTKVDGWIAANLTECWHMQKHHLLLHSGCMHASACKCLSLMQLNPQHSMGKNCIMAFLTFNLASME